tara:strand:- start:31077 stop:31286 length:210 start_codon:yes stop_codon:yes gene_type:complete
LLCKSSYTLRLVIKKGGGNRPFEALATLCNSYNQSTKKVLHSIQGYFGEITHEAFTAFPDNKLIEKLSG